MIVELIILSFVGLILVLTEIFIWYYSGKEYDNIIFGVTLPTDILKSRDIDLFRIKYKNLCYVCFFITIFSCIPFVFSNFYSTFFLIYLFVWIIIYTFLLLFPYILINRQLYSLKKEKGWFLTTAKVITIDTVASKFKNKKNVSPYWLIGAVLIALFPITIEVIFKHSLTLNLLFFLTVISLIEKAFSLFFYNITKKLKTKTYSENSDINVTLNWERQRIWSLFWIVFAYVDSLTFLCSYFAIFKLNNIILSVIIYCLTVTIIIIFASYTFSKFKNTEKELTVNDDKAILVDDDEYWYWGMFYCNPNDKSSFVSRGGSKVTVNFASTGGKAFMCGTLIFTLVIIIGALFLPLALNSSDPVINISNPKDITINTSMYSTSFSRKDVVSISLINNIPDGIHTNGIGTDEYSRGNFDLDKYGQGKLYVFNNCPPYIYIKLKDGYIIYNYKDKNKTLTLYNKLLKLEKGLS